MPDDIQTMTPDELVEADELLAAVPEEAAPMDISEADGFMTAVNLLPKTPGTREWLPWILSTSGDMKASTGSPERDKKLRAILLRRFKMIAKQLSSSVPLDPVYFEIEDSEEPSEGQRSPEVLQPFALGFLEAAQKWPGILDSNSPQIARSLHGILRHLPEESLGDFEPVKQILDKEAPLEDLPAALSDMVSCLAEIAQVTKGYDLPELNEPSDGEEKA